MSLQVHDQFKQIWHKSKKSYWYLKKELFKQSLKMQIGYKQVPHNLYFIGKKKHEMIKGNSDAVAILLL